MKKLKLIRAIVLLPGMATVIIPGIVISVTDTVNIGWSLPSPLNVVPSVLGCLLICAGILLLLKTVPSFAAVGKGTLAPWDPTQKLVVHGVYRHVRNPMISGVSGILLGEAVAVGSLPLLFWFAIFLLGNLIYMPLVEEPGLVRRFGADYVLYQQHVPRWIPQLRPWQGSVRDADERQGEQE